MDFPIFFYLYRNKVKYPNFFLIFFPKILAKQYNHLEVILIYHRKAQEKIFQEVNILANNYPYYPQQPVIQPQLPYQRPGVSYVDQTQPQMGIKGRPVSSIDEARAISIDFDGSVFYFPDLANKRIYTKQINMDGTSSLNVYEWKNDPVVNSPQYVTREEFETVLTQLKQAIENQSKKEPEPEEQPVKFDF